MEIQSVEKYFEFPKEVLQNLVKSEYELSNFQKSIKCGNTIDVGLELMQELDWQFRIIRPLIADLKGIALIDPDFPSVTKPESAPAISVLMDIYDTLEKRRIFLFETMEAAFESLENLVETFKQNAEINYTNAKEIEMECASILSKKKQLIGDIQMEMCRRIKNVNNIENVEWETTVEQLFKERSLSMSDLLEEKIVDESMILGNPQDFKHCATKAVLSDDMETAENIPERIQIQSSLNNEEYVPDDTDREVKKVKLSINSPLDINAEDKENFSESIQFRSQKSEGMFSSASPKGRLSVLKLSQEHPLDDMSTDDELVLSLSKSSATISQVTYADN
ncbi:hypothetical protein HDV01_004884 [Terramyces sp. JEL0728]|nr:hypothetical protein HDV01_004884 [Terramyces sp. JEL0728]